MNMDLERLYFSQIILNGLVLPIIALLMVQVLHRKHRTLEIKIFFRMLVMVMVQSLAYMTGFVLLINPQLPEGTIVFVLALFCDFALGIIPITMVVHWLLFVEYTLHQSIDIIRRRYPVLMIPFGIGLLISVFNTVAVIPESTPLIILQIAYVLNRLSILIWLFYVVTSYAVFFAEKKTKSIPQYIRLTPTVISIMLGLVISALTPFQIDALGYAIGLLFADYYMFRRLSYVDQETGFFNEKYLAVLDREAEKKGISDVTVIHFRTAGDRKKLAGILKYWEPEYSKIVIKDDGEFLVLSETLKKSTTERFMHLVQGHCESEGLETKTSYEVIRKKTSQDA